MKSETSRSSGKVPGAIVIVAMAAVLAVSVYAKGKGWKTRVIQTVYPTYGATDRPAITLTRPADYEGNVPLDAFVAADVRLPNIGRVIDRRTAHAASVKLYRTHDQLAIPATVNTSGGGDALVLKPLEPLQANTQYTFEVNPGLCDTGGTPFRAFTTHFTTASSASYSSFPVAFEQVPLPVTNDLMITCVAMGPDDRLYASTIDGRMLRFEIGPDGTLAPPQVMATVMQYNQGPRLISGFVFDPTSTADNPVIWLSHGQLAMRKVDEWTGKVSRLSGANLEVYEDVLIHLPRSARDHLNNQLCFGPDGALYFAQASNTAMGAPDHEWGWRPERVLSAAILRLDISKLARLPLDVQTEEGNSYDAFAPDAPLTVYATGVRNAYDLLWHSNGRLYAPINGSAAGGNTPATPSDPNQYRRRIDAEGFARYAGPSVDGIEAVSATQDDILLNVARHGYYGHPNPQRSEYVLGGGNPTTGADPYELAQYPVGTLPDRNWRPPAFDFGKNLAPTGIIEYQSNRFGGVLRGKVLITRYSGGDDVIVLSCGESGEITQAITGIEGLASLQDPLDLTENPKTGCIYVSELGAKRMVLLRPREGETSPRVSRRDLPTSIEVRAN